MVYGLGILIAGRLRSVPYRTELLSWRPGWTRSYECRRRRYGREDIEV